MPHSNRKIIFITGGERSGKSAFAQNLALDMTNSPVYLATARHWDHDFSQRIEKHKNDRDENWTTIEEEKKISTLYLEKKVVVLDCVTLWLTNFFNDNQYNAEKALEQAKRNGITLLTRILH